MILALNSSTLNHKNWEKLLEENNSGCIYHTFEWAQVWEKSFSNFQALFLVLLEDQQNYKCGMPIMRVKKFGLESFYSMPFGTYGGIISTQPDSQFITTFYKNVLELLQSFKQTRIQVVDFQNSSSNLHNLGFKKVNSFTHIIDLVKLQAENKLSSLLEKRGYTQSQKKSVTVREVQDLSGIELHYQLACKTATKHKRESPRYPLEFFKKIFDFLQPKEYLKLFVAYRERKPLASTLNLLFKDTLYYWDGASDPEALDLRPNDALFGYSLLWAMENKIKIINLGGSPAAAQGLVQFKEAWGGEKKIYPVYDRKTTLGKIVYALKGSG